MWVGVSAGWCKCGWPIIGGEQEKCVEDMFMEQNVSAKKGGEGIREAENGIRGMFFFLLSSVKSP